MASGLTQAIHMAARRYCMDEAARWRRAESEGSHPEAENPLPRYSVLKTILAEVQRLPPDEFASEDEARDLLALAGEIAEDSMTRHWARRSASAAQAMREERERFVAYIRRLSPSDLAKVEPLPEPGPSWYALVGEMHGEPRTRHYLGVDRMPAAAVLVLEPEEHGVFLFRYAADGTFGGDSWLFTLEDAKSQAEFEYPGVVFEWHEIPRDVENRTAYALERLAQQP